MNIEAAPAPKHLIVEHTANALLYADSPSFRTRVADIGNQYLNGRPLLLQCIPAKGLQGWPTSLRRPVKRQKLSPEEPKPNRSISHPRRPLGKTSTSRLATDPEATPASKDTPRRLKNDLQHSVDTGAYPLVSNEIRKDEQRAAGSRHHNPNVDTRPLVEPAFLQHSSHATPPIIESGKKLGRDETIATRNRMRGVPQRRNEDLCLSHPKESVDNPLSSEFCTVQTSSGAAGSPEKPTFKRGVQTTSQGPLSRRICSWCQTEHSRQWRKGPAGPATLCLSCGAKWTYQQKRTNEKGQVKSKVRRKPAASVARIEVHERSRNELDSDGNHSVHQPQRSIRSPVNGADPRKSHEWICRNMFPDREVRRAVSANQAIRLEELVAAEVLNLRGKPCPTMQNWDKSSSKSRPAPRCDDEVLKPCIGLSPRKSAPKFDKTMDLVAHRNQATSKSINKKKRKVLNFDTPEAAGARQVNAVTSTAYLSSSRAGACGITEPATVQEIAAEEPVAQAGQRASELARHQSSVHSPSTDEQGAQTRYPAGLHQRSAEGTPSEGKLAARKLTQISTQAALLQAHQDFQDGLGHLEDDTLGNQYTSTGQLVTPPTTRDLSESSDMKRAPICTQDLFDQTLDFGSPSPTNKLQIRSQRAEQPRLPNQETQQIDFDMVPPDRLPTSPPPSSLPNFDLNVDMFGGDSRICTPAHSAVATYQGGWEEDETSKHGISNRTADPVLFSSKTETVGHPSTVGGLWQPDKQGMNSQSVDVERIIAEAGSFLDTWKT